ncbi:two-component regulator propeller domain-containing protein [Candidatus Halobeggiatoa sp. HSG11]|nr:two-component regulator propeller domain-containing protein [Candidatus Halobeggiatoa sp. HSG11]
MKTFSLSILLLFGLFTMVQADELVFENTVLLDSTIVPQQYFSSEDENAVWKHFTNRDQINAFALSKDEIDLWMETKGELGKRNALDEVNLWVGTNGGLEKRNALTGELERLYIVKDGLPDIMIYDLALDNQGGIWVGTDGGLGHLTADGFWQIFNTENFSLPNNFVRSLLSDNQGGIWVGTDGGLGHRTADGLWQIFNTDNFSLPSNFVRSILSDNQGGIWVGTAGGLAHQKADGSWQIFNTENSNLPNNSVNTLLSDEQRGIWVGTAGGLAHQKVDGSWQIFNTENSSLPSNSVYSLLSDEQGGIWIGTDSSGIVHLEANGSWQPFRDNSSPPSNSISSLLSDKQGRVWVGTDNGLAYLTADNSWQITDLPNNSVNTLLSNEQGGIWIGTDGGLAHLTTADNSWQIFNTENFLPSNSVYSLLSDEQGGIWIGTDGGLARLTTDGFWQIFNTENSSLPSNSVYSLLSDEQGGILVGTDGGLAHRKVDNSWQIINTEDNYNLFHNKTSIALDGEGEVWTETINSGLAHLGTGQKSCVQNSPATGSDCMANRKRAAILIRPNSSREPIKAEVRAANFMISYAYNALQARGYKNTQIYFLSYTVDLDFNNDSVIDEIVDAPYTLPELRNPNNKRRNLTVADIEKAFVWAKNKGKLEQPLVVIFVGHGLDRQLLLNPDETRKEDEILTADKFTHLLNDYQDSVRDQEVVVILEASHSGTFIEPLTDYNRPRLIISSTDTNTGDGSSYSHDYGRTSFLISFLNYVVRGSATFEGGLGFITNSLAALQQKPMLSISISSIETECFDNTCEDGAMGTNDLDLTPTNTKGGIITLNKALNLEAKASANLSVWASVINLDTKKPNSQGFSDTDVFKPSGVNEDIYSGTFDGFKTPGKYEVIYKSQDGTEEPNESAPVPYTAIAPTAFGTSSASTKSTAKLLPVHRYSSMEHEGRFYYTLNQEEMDTKIDPKVWKRDSIVYYAYDVKPKLELETAFDETVLDGTVAEGTDPVYCFWSNQKQVHYFTPHEKEIKTIDTSVWKLYHVSWYVYTTPQPNTVPVYFFWSDVYQAHFFTADADEREAYIKNSNWTYVEYPAFYTPKPK